MPFDASVTFKSKFEAWSASSDLRTLEQAQAWYSAAQDVEHLVASEAWIEKAYRLCLHNIRNRIANTLHRRGAA